jgi:hypothetical protein
VDKQLKVESLPKPARQLILASDAYPGKQIAPLQSKKAAVMFTHPVMRETPTKKNEPLFEPMQTLEISDIQQNDEFEYLMSKESQLSEASKSSSKKSGKHTPNIHPPMHFVSVKNSVVPDPLNEQTIQTAKHERKTKAGVKKDTLEMARYNTDK